MHSGEPGGARRVDGSGEAGDVRVVLGVLSLLVALAAVGYVARSQTRVVTAALPAPSAAPSSSPATVGAGARSIEDKARADVEQALREGARRTEDADR